MSIINDDFWAFPGEVAIIGRLLTGYSEIELSLLHCISQGGAGLDQALKTMFCERGEKKRIDSAEALGRAVYQKFGLYALYAHTVDDMRHCLAVRNQYAHCQWFRDAGTRLAFVNLEELASTAMTVSDLQSLMVRHVDAALLNHQEAFFVYVKESFDYLNSEAQVAAGRVSTPFRPKPKTVARPPLHIP